MIRRPHCTARSARFRTQWPPASTTRSSATAAGSTLAAARVEPEYLAIVAADTMEPVSTIEGDVLVAVAARVGSVRLIDNVPITVSKSGLSSTDTTVATPHGAPTT